MIGFHLAVCLSGKVLHQGSPIWRIDIDDCQMNVVRQAGERSGSKEDDR